MEFVPLSLELINEGDLLRDFNQKIIDGSEELLAYRERHGDISSEGKEITISLKVKIKLDNPQEDFYSIKGEIEMKVPNPPAKVSLGLQRESGGVQKLMVQDSGSTKDDPKQMKLFSEKIGG